MELHWIDASLKRWARWLTFQIDKTMSWSKFSSIVNLGMPKAPFNNLPAALNGIDEECNQINEVVKKRLDEADRMKIFLFYVQYHCNRRATARKLGITDKTVRVHIATIQAKIARHLDDMREEAKQPEPPKKRGRPKKVKESKIAV